MSPSASSKRPSRRATAPVKDPFSCPNSSDSRTPCASAAQFTFTNGLDSRALLMWMARATISLPVPVSPRKRTVAVVCATCSTRASTSRRAGESPTMAPKSNAPCASLASMPAYSASCSDSRLFSRPR